jgi:hypothetical protein
VGRLETVQTTVIDMRCAMWHQLENVNVSAASPGDIECDAECWLHVGRVFNCYEDEWRRNHHASKSFR